MNKLIGIIGFDIVVMFIPLLIGVAPDLVDWVSYVLIGLSTITIISLVLSEENGDTLNTLQKERRTRPEWWNTYDLMSDVTFATVWIIHDFYTVVLMLIMVKIFTIIKVPNYYKKGEIDG